MLISILVLSSTVHAVLWCLYTSRYGDYKKLDAITKNIVNKFLSLMDFDFALNCKKV